MHVGPSDYVPWLTDRKWCYIRMEGKSFGDVPLNIELKMEVNLQLTYFFKFVKRREKFNSKLNY